MHHDAPSAQIDFLPMPPAPHPRIGWAFTCRAGGFSEGAWGGWQEKQPDATTRPTGPDGAQDAAAKGADAMPSATRSPTPAPGAQAHTHTHTEDDAPAPKAGSPGLNLGALCGDDPEAVARNRALLSDAIGLPISWLKQVHGSAVFIAETPTPAASAPTAAPTSSLPAGAAAGGPAPSEAGSAATTSNGPSTAGSTPQASMASPALPDPRSAPEADGQISTQPGRALAVLVADCLPVLLADREGRVVGAAHAGWRGLLDGVLEATVKQMKNRVPDADLVAWLGPCIGPTAFEVGEEVRDAFVSRDPVAEAAFVPGQLPGKWLANLPMLARQRLARVGVTDILDSQLCTYRDPKRFWSFRRDRTCGRMAGVVWIKTPTDPQP